MSETSGMPATQDTNPFGTDNWCIVEIMGHVRVAGQCSEQNIAGTAMLRIDVPQTQHQPAFTRYYGSNAIYAIHPVGKDVARAMAVKLKQQPVASWDISEMVEKLQKQRQLSIEQDNGYDDEDEDDETF